MATQAQLATHPFAGPKVLYRPSNMDPKQRFYRHFLDSEASESIHLIYCILQNGPTDVQPGLRDDIAQLESVAVIGGERQAAIDHVLAGISKLQNEVADAAEFTPAYDRKQYSEVRLFSTRCREKCRLNVLVRHDLGRQGAARQAQ